MPEIGKVVLQQVNRAVLVGSQFSSTANVTMADIKDVDTTNVHNGYTLIFSAANNKYEMKSAQELTASITQIDGGTF